MNFRSKCDLFSIVLYHREIRIAIGNFHSYLVIFFYNDRKRYHWRAKARILLLCKKLIDKLDIVQGTRACYIKSDYLHSRVYTISLSFNSLSTIFENSTTSGQRVLRFRIRKRIRKYNKSSLI